MSSRIVIKQWCKLQLEITRHSVCVAEDGLVRIWGSNEQVQLGVGDGTDDDTNVNL